MLNIKDKYNSIFHYGSKGGNNPRFDGFSNANGNTPAFTCPGLTNISLFLSRLRSTSVARRISTFLKFGNLGCKSGPRFEFGGLGNLKKKKRTFNVRRISFLLICGFI